MASISDVCFLLLCPLDASYDAYCLFLIEINLETPQELVTRESSLIHQTIALSLSLSVQLHESSCDCKLINAVIVNKISSSELLTSIGHPLPDRGQKVRNFNVRQTLESSRHPQDWFFYHL